VVRVLNWLSYRNGSAHRSTERSSLSGKETRAQLDYLARYYPKVSPAVIARGMLAMFRYDATSVLPTIRVPVLVVVGDGDRQTTPEAGMFMREAIPNADLFTLRQARHAGLFEDHEAFHARITDFVTHCAAGQASPTAAAQIIQPPRSG
jgi:pimeloyl-ACP methyl ester carboxylesterase